MKKTIKSLESSDNLTMSMGKIEFAELNLILAHEKLGLAYAPDQVMSAFKVYAKCLWLSDKNDMKDYNSLKNRLLRWRNDNFTPQEGVSIFEGIDENKKDLTKLAEEILTNLMRFYENTPRIYYVWLLRDWDIFDDEIVQKARIWMADDCDYQEDIDSTWYEKY